MNFILRVKLVRFEPCSPPYLKWTLYIHINYNMNVCMYMNVCKHMNILYHICMYAFKYAYMYNSTCMYMHIYLHTKDTHHMKVAIPISKWLP